MTTAKRTPNRNRSGKAGGLNRPDGDDEVNTEVENTARGAKKGKLAPPPPQPLPSGPSALNQLLANNAKRKSKLGKSAAANMGTQSMPYTRKRDGQQLVKWQAQIHLDVHLELEALLKTLEASAGYNRTDVLSVILRDGVRQHRKALRVA